MLKPIKKKIVELRDIWPIYFTFQIANNKGADQTARMRRLVCAFCCSQATKSGFITLRPIWYWSPQASWPPPGCSPGTFSLQKIENSIPTTRYQPQFNIGMYPRLTPTHPCLSTKNQSLTSRHMTPKQRRINVNATSWRRIDVSATLF